MSYTYPEALTALESVANDFIKLMRPAHKVPVRIVCDATAQTASVIWDQWSITVNMPVRPLTVRMAQSEFDDWVAYVLHELGHPTHTNKAAWEAACRAGLGQMTNALEDVRMERAVIASGIVRNAQAVLSRLLSRKIAEARANNWRPNARAEFGWTIAVLGRAANGYAFEAADMDWIKSQITPNGTVAKVLAWAMPALAACQSAADCSALAARIMAALAAANPQGNNPRGNPQGNNPQGGEAGEAGDAGEAGEAAGETGEAGEVGEAGTEKTDRQPPQGDGAGSSTNSGKGNGKGKGKGPKDPGANDETPVTDEKDLTTHDLAPETDDALRGGEAQRTAEIIEVLREVNITKKPRKAGPNDTPAPDCDVTALRNLAARASRQRALLARALRANDTDDYSKGRLSGRLDRTALNRAVTGAPNVFARRDVTEGFDTDVTVLLDGSSSMAGRNMTAAVETGLVVAQAAASVGAACTVEVFSSGGFWRIGDAASKRQPEVEPFAKMLFAAGGSTPLCANMARAAMTQAARAGHKRRVMFVVTDGDCNMGHGTVKRTREYLENVHGTVLAHVSIENPVRGAFKAEICVPRGQSITDLGLEHFVKVLQAL